MKKQKQFMVRQGDVFIELVADLPANLKPQPREHGKIVLAHGEVTGHSHAIAAHEHEAWLDDAGVTYLEVREAMALLEHQEHDTIKLPVGKYRVTRQREYAPEAPRNVAD